MQYVKVKAAEDCISCKSCEAACSQAYYKTDDGAYSCIHIREDRIHACTQCGECASVCPVEAIHPNAKGVYIIDRKLCVGCLACMDICPEEVICKSDKNLFATKCTACGLCVKACPREVLELFTDSPAS